MRFQGKTALVTGGGSGMGARVAERLAAEGAAVAVMDRNESAAATVSKQIEASGGTAFTVSGNVASAADVSAAVARVAGECGKIDILVHCAGILRDGNLLDMEKATWDAVIEVNLRGTLNVTEAVARHMVSQGKGKIVHFGSRALLGDIGRANYVVSKTGVASLVRSYALRLSPLGINVNAVCPGFIETPMTTWMSPEIWNKATQVTPVRRTGTPDDVANAVLFLSSPESDFVTGQLMFVCGGRSMIPVKSGNLTRL